MPNAITDTAGATAPDHVDDYVKAFRTGQALMPPPAQISSMDHLTNAVTGRLAVSAGAQRDQAARRAELLEAIGVSLNNLPYAQRSSVLAHLAPALAKEGIPAHTVIDFDPTDDALEQSIEKARAATTLLGNS